MRDADHLDDDTTRGAPPRPLAARDGGVAGPDAVRVTRSEEELAIDTRVVQAGHVAVRKHVETEHVTRPVVRTREEVTVERRPVDSTRGTDVTVTDDEVRIPIVEEEIIVLKRPVVKEELVIRTRPVTEEVTVEADLRKERVEVDRSALDRPGAGGAGAEGPAR